MPTLLSAAAALTSGNPLATHQIKLGASEQPFMMGDGIDNWAMFAAGTPSKRTEMIHVTQAAGSVLQVGFSLFFCDFQEENAEIAPFFVHFDKK